MNIKEQTRYIELIEKLGLNPKIYIKLLSLYLEFIKKYNKLNSTFNLSNPIQLYTMFSYLLKEGYLSQNKLILADNKNPIDVPGIFGADIINGYAVCRHVSALFTDILNSYGINSIILPVYTNPYSINLDLERRINGNHIITYAYQDGKSYYLDSTILKTYQPKKFNKYILSDNNKYNIKIRPKKIKIINQVSSVISINTYLDKKMINNYPTLTQEERENLITSTKKICDNNIDIFEEFYKDNHELYNSIANNLSRVKKLK